jgi:hypothetical protein
MPNLTDLTDQECIFLLEVLKREEKRQPLQAVGRLDKDVSDEQDVQQKALKDLLWRLQAVCMSRTELEEEVNREVVAERLAGYC